MILTITQAISKPIMSLVQFFWMAFLNAVKSTNSENNSRKTPTPTNGMALFALNKVETIPGIKTSKAPVTPELIAFISKTFFSVILFGFCFHKGIPQTDFYDYLYTTSS